MWVEVQDGSRFCEVPTCRPAQERRAQAGGDGAAPSKKSLGSVQHAMRAHARKQMQAGRHERTRVSAQIPAQQDCMAGEWARPLGRQPSPCCACPHPVEQPSLFQELATVSMHLQVQGGRDLVRGGEAGAAR